ncbi:hypothetical protein [Haliangium sp.]|uniref:hypothetical protein n=1 Tax=Haliangium sp. TaxID=2663208 RepID=UPI003D09B588
MPGEAAAQIDGRCHGDEFRVDLAELNDIDLGHDPRESLEQRRDWLWAMLSGRLESTGTLDGLLVGNATTPLIRDDALAHVLDHPVGTSRSSIAADGTVVVMLEDDAPAVMEVRLLDAIDQEALYLAQTPHAVIAYRYRLDDRADYAEICRVGRFDERWIESRERGFRRATVSSTRGLKNFLDGGVDLLTAQCTRDGLALTGRSRPRAQKAPMTVEHIAELPQPKRLSYVPPEELGVTPEERAAAQDPTFASLLRVLANPRLLDSEPNLRLPEMFRELLAWRRAHPKVSPKALLLSWMTQMRRESQLGFSLDPKIRAAEATRNLEALIDASTDPARLAALLYSWETSPDDAVDLVDISAGAKANGLSGLLPSALARLREQLRRSSDDDARVVLLTAASEADDSVTALIAGVADIVHHRSVYQCARYDGPLQGTRTGMTLFYTDLLMKLWSIDKFDSAPEMHIPGFESVVGHELSGAYCSAEEQEHPFTRAWLGLRYDQYVHEQGHRARFAPVVARVFGKGSEFGSDHEEEVEASADMRRFHRWWNAHYARVAEWEPQYELLNQIMKWSMVRHTAALSDYPDCMSFLDEIEVEHQLRFDSWVAAHAELRWRGPVPVLNRSDEPTECIRALQSRSYSSCGSGLSLVGGVSLGGRADLVSRPMQAAPRAPQLRQINAGAGTRLEVGRYGRVRADHVATSDGYLQRIEVDLADRSFTTRIDPAQTQRGVRHSYGAGTDDHGVGRTVGKRWQLDHGTLSGEASINRFGVGRLRVSDVRASVLRAGMRLGDAARLRQLGTTAARRMGNGTTSLADAVADLPGIKKLQRLSDNEVVITLASDQGTQRYIFTSSNGIRGPPNSLSVRFGIPGSPNNVEMVLVTRTDAMRMSRAGALTEIPLKPAHQLPAQLRQSIAHGDNANLLRHIDEHLATAPGDLGLVRDQLRGNIRALSRRGQDTTALERTLMSVDIRYPKLSGPMVEHSALPADARAFYVPRSYATQYAELAAHPVGTSPATGPGRAAASHHARLIGEARQAAGPSRLPKVVQVGDTEYVLISRPGFATSTAVGQLYVVQPCRAEHAPDRDDGSVPCYGRSQGHRSEYRQRQELLHRACQLDPTDSQAQRLEQCKVADGAKL